MTVVELRRYRDRHDSYTDPQRIHLLEDDVDRVEDRQSAQDAMMASIKNRVTGVLISLVLLLATGLLNLWIITR